jgi:AraC-like DNA-binding protein
LAIIKNQKGNIESAAASSFLGVSDAHLRRLFKRYVGLTFGQHVRKVKMAQAADLLVDPSLSIKEIASKVGYDDVSNFYRDFRKVHGATPNHLRQHFLLKISSSDCIPRVVHRGNNPERRHHSGEE